MLLVVAFAPNILAAQGRCIFGLLCICRYPRSYHPHASETLSLIVSGSCCSSPVLALFCVPTRRYVVPLVNAAVSAGVRNPGHVVPSAAITRVTDEASLGNCLRVMVRIQPSRDSPPRSNTKSKLSPFLTRLISLAMVRLHFINQGSILLSLVYCRSIGIVYHHLTRDRHLMLC